MRRVWGRVGAVLIVELREPAKGGGAWSRGVAPQDGREGSNERGGGGLNRFRSGSSSGEGRALTSRRPGVCERIELGWLGEKGHVHRILSIPLLN